MSSSEISKIYSQYQHSLETAQEEFDARLKEFAEFLRTRYTELIQHHVVHFHPLFSNQIGRLEIKRYAENFFETSDIDFVAIDGSCHKETGADFISFYGGAYGSKGTVSLAGPSGIIRYHRWEFNKDVSMVAFIPVPPEMMTNTIGDEILENSEMPPVLSDYEISEMSSLHTKIMQLAEVYLAYTLAQSAVQMPRVIMIDNTLCGILANTSFSPKNVRMQEGDFDGERIALADMHIALSHPMSQVLSVPSTKNFQPHFRVIAEAVWKGDSTIRWDECSEGFPRRNFEAGAKYLDKKVNAGSFDRAELAFTFSEDPRASWRKTLRIFENICERIFREKEPYSITYRVRGGERRNYFLPRDIQFLVGVGLRALIEICWRRKTLLVGVVKDSFSRYYYRNYLSAISLVNGDNVVRHLRLPLTDRTIAEMLPNIIEELKAPWSTIEYDSCFMTLRPWKDENGNWEMKGYDHPSLGETTRPERIFLRSLAQFFVTEDKSLASHALFIDRLVHPEWDDRDSDNLVLRTDFFGPIQPLFYENASRLHKLTTYLLSVLVRNHFPEALGYPDPLHKADWGAKSLKRRVTSLLESSEWAYRANPRERTFREIRDSFRR